MTAAGRAGASAHQVLATLGYGDAIGNEVLGIQRALRAAGFTSDIFVETVDPRLEHLTRDYRDLIGGLDAADLLIHHFSIGSRASRVAYALPNRMVLVYHNITPPEYFVGVHALLAQLCFMGRRELGAYRDRCVLALGDSAFNRAELDRLGFAATGVLPVVPDFSHLDAEPNRFVAREFDDDRTNLLFVGRVIPNKRFEDLIRIYHAYRTLYDPGARLLLVGSYSGFEWYLTMLQAMAGRLGARDVHFAGHVSNEELAAYYEVADLFLCASEHEGFCVPLVEAFYARVPVVAYAAAAVPATMDGGGLLYDTKDPRQVASLLRAVLSDDGVYRGVLASQDAALTRLRGRDFAGTLLGFVERALAAPAETRHAVAADFWEQVRVEEHYEHLREHRPALYQALPKEQDVARSREDR